MPKIIDQKLEGMIKTLFEESYKSRPLSIKLKKLGYDISHMSVSKSLEVSGKDVKQLQKERYLCLITNAPRDPK
jgi:hypothetical protein